MTRPMFLSREEMLARRGDRRFQGAFFIAVKSTGIFCRVGCPARAPRPENIEFFLTAQEAMDAGYRACLRCRPLDGGDVAWLEPLLARLDRHPDLPLTDATLRAEGFSPGRVRAAFQRTYGMTFHGYARIRRLTHALQHLEEGSGVYQAALEAGYGSDSGFRTAFARAFGTSPGRSTSAAVARSTIIESPLGTMVAVATRQGLALLEFHDRRALATGLAEVQRHVGGPILPGEDPVLDETRRQLEAYFAGRRTTFSIPLDLFGSPFQRAVWEALLAIPHGARRSYGALAVELGRKGAERAVGRANGQNRIAVVVPCHRVVGADGSLTGYGGGLWRKERLLLLESKLLQERM